MAKLKGSEKTLAEDPNLGIEIPYSIQGLPQGDSAVVRILIPASAIRKNDSVFKDEIVRRLSNPHAEDRTSPRALARNLLWQTKTSNSYFLESLGSGLEEFRLKWKTSEKAAIRLILANHRNLHSLVEIGYRSTRLDPAGQPIAKPRAYLGKVVGMEEETVLLETHFGLRRFRTEAIAWAAASPSTSHKILAVDFFFKAVNGKQYVDYSWLGRDAIEADEPRDLLLAEEETVDKYDDGGLTRIPVNRSAALLLTPFLGKRVYIEYFKDDESLVMATATKLKAFDWDTDRKYPEDGISLKLTMTKGKTLAVGSGGFIRIGLLKKITEKQALTTKESGGPTHGQD